MVAGDTLTIAGLGDSLTYGWMVRRGFFDRCCDLLGERFPAAEIRSVNAGIPGDTAAGGLRRLAPLVHPRPDVVTVQFGLNDLFGGVGEASFRGALDRIAGQLLDAGAVPVLCTSCPVGAAWDDGGVDRFYGVIREVAAARDVPLADLERHWLENVDPSFGPDDLFQEDGVHPTDPGHALMAAGLAELFR
ncbi:MAG: hypothetical protein JRI55_24890 [Deltaproteobacteria bacterium]|jgi:acyl-CoA thioesterase-1|nr:hypothetical protein [Deltaproteobacteria bacterium]